MLKIRLMTGIQVAMIIGALLLSSCGANVPELTPTVTFGAEEIRTQAVATFSADLTQTALFAPTDTPAATASPALPTLATSTAGTPFGPVATTVGGGTGATAVTSCYGLTFVSDVSIPDNTQMDPGETFTKTWKVLNSGSCAWDAGFKFALTGGEAMGSSTLTIPSAVAAGAQSDISVPMVAPNKTGTLRGNWRMSTASGQFFGDEVYVQIVVGTATAATNTGAAPVVPTVTITSTP